MSFRFQHRLRVRWAEVDAQKVVFNGHYLTYLDVAATEYWRHAGLPYPDPWRALNSDIYVRRNALNYHAPALLDDRLSIGVRLQTLGNTSLTLAWDVRRDGHLLVDGEVVYVCVSLEGGRPHPVPAEARQQLEAFEAGQPVWLDAVGDWTAVGAAAAEVRRQVFIEEQGIAESDEWDKDDARAWHVVVHNLSGWPAATGRLIPGDHPSEARIGRMAVQRCARGIGLGRRVLDKLIELARQQDRPRLSLHAQLSAQPLYAAAGFEPVGEVFDEVGIPHQKMVLTL
jgi:YbgC/YbaW family acyl-CoA thioester hydrolase